MDLVLYALMVIAGMFVLGGIATWLLLKLIVLCIKDPVEPWK